MYSTSFYNIYLRDAKDFILKFLFAWDGIWKPRNDILPGRSSVINPITLIMEIAPLKIGMWCSYSLNLLPTGANDFFSYIYFLIFTLLSCVMVGYHSSKNICVSSFIDWNSITNSFYTDCGFGEGGRPTELKSKVFTMLCAMLDQWATAWYLFHHLVKLPLIASCIIQIIMLIGTIVPFFFGISIMYLVVYILLSNGFQGRLFSLPICWHKEKWINNLPKVLSVFCSPSNCWLVF